MTLASGLAPVFPTVPTINGDEKQHRRQIAEMLNRINGGKFNCVNELTLNPSATSTNLVDSRIGASSFIWFMPQTAHAAAALSSIYVPPATITKGQAVIQHASLANSDQTFLVLILG